MLKNDPFKKIEVDKIGKIIGPERDHICANCIFYTFKKRKSGGWAYCRLWKKHFPNQRPGGTPAGRRTCSNFKQQ